MKSTLVISLILCLLGIVKKSYSQENSGNIIYFTKCYSQEKYTEASKIGAQILQSPTLRPKNDERFRLLYKTIRAFAKNGQLDMAHEMLINLNKTKSDKLFIDYIKLYQGITSLALNKQKEAKFIFTTLLEDNSSTLLVDSVKAKIYHNLAVIYYKEGKRALQLEYLNKSFELEEKILLSNSNYENYNLSVEVYTSTLYNSYRQYEKAYRVFQDALAQPFNKSINNNNHALYENYIELLLDMGMENRAKLYIKQLTQYYDGKPNLLISDHASLLITLARYYRIQNDYTNAILYSTKTLAITSNNPNIYARNSAYEILVQCYYNLQQHDKIKIYLRRYIQDCKSTYKKELASAYLTSGQYHAKVYDDDNAYAYIDSAKHLYYQELNLPLDRTFENILALTYFNLEQYNQCLYHLENVRQVMKENSNYKEYFFWDNSYEMAMSYNHLKQYRKAHQLLSETVREMLKLYPHLQDQSSSIQSSYFAKLYRSINIELADNLHQQYLKNGQLHYLQEAMYCIEEADKGLENLRSKQNYDRDRIMTGEQYYHFTKQSAKVAMALYNASSKKEYLTKAFNYIQKGKSYALMQGVNEKNYKLNSGVPLEMINSLNRFKEEYDRYTKRYNEAFFSENNDKTLIAQLNEKMGQTMGQIDSINTLIKNNFPEYHQKEARAPFLTIDQIQKKLGVNQIIIDYFQTEHELFRFTIDKDSIQCNVIQLDAKFHTHLQLVRNEISSPFVGQHTIEDIQKFARASHALYSTLLKDIEHLLKDKELIIVPHSELSYLPFEVLLTKDVSKGKPKFKEYPWLIKEQVISYSYNTAMLDNFSEASIEFNKVLTFAPKYTGKSTPDVLNLDNDTKLDTVLKPLFGAQEEIANIEKLFDTQSFKGSEANKPNFIAAMQNNDILHLAMHSLNDEIQPFNSQIVFASTDTINGCFSAGEIYNYSMKSPLAVLSSCSTGRGQKQEGEGLLSIARAFTYAGVKSQVMTLWPVNDVSGANIVGHFYAQLKVGHSKNKALQISKLDYINSADGVKSHPYYWANYVLAGNTSPVKQKMPKGIFIYLLAFAMLSVTILFFYDRKKS